jgi:hypothetical protein
MKIVRSKGQHCAENVAELFLRVAVTSPEAFARSIGAHAPMLGDRGSEAYPLGSDLRPQRFGQCDIYINNEIYY